MVAYIHRLWTLRIIFFAHMPKPLDKYPELDPNVRGIFDRILAAVAEERKRRKSAEYVEAQLRIDAAEKLRHQAREVAAKKEEAVRLNAQRYEEAQRLTALMANNPATLKELDIPKFIR